VRWEIPPRRGAFKFIETMGIYDRDYYSQEREERLIKIERVHTEIWVKIEEQEKMLDQLLAPPKGAQRAPRKDTMPRGGK